MTPSCSSVAPELGGGVRELLENLTRRISWEWGLDPTFAAKVAAVLYLFQRETNVRLDIISGYRSAEEQQQLIDQGTGAPQQLSNHRLCPAHAVDVWPATIPTGHVRATLGRIVTMQGLRWGGCSCSQPGCCNPETGEPQDWNHIDDGPALEKAR